MRILLSEGSSLTSRQVATRLGQLGHSVEVLSSSRICLTRFTRRVSKVHAVPSFGREPLAWFEAAKKIARESRIDVLFPTHEQAAVLSAWRRELDVATIVPAFESLARVQDKISAYRTLEEIGVPQPRSAVARSRDDLKGVTFPLYVKRAIGTASNSVRRATSPAELEETAAALGLGANDLLVQSEADGPLAMVQAVADHGRLVAHHANLRVREGVGGGAALKESVVLPTMAGHLEKLVGALDWHGPLSMDVIVTGEGPLVIDVNPRIIEPMNAWASGVDLVGAMLALARGERPDAQPVGTPGVRTRQLLLAVLGAAQRQGSRRAVARELVQAMRGEGEIGAAVEELTPVSGDPRAAIPVVAAAVATLISPPLWRSFYADAVEEYALTPAGWSEFASASAGCAGLALTM